ncbi:MAG TPA: hypothetical protein VHC18_14010 [Amycolatopsis sp.]|nr:hypothetical protein [Amycolatopsis sp.]
MSEHHERPVGARPEADRSDWTEQDLLTVDEALPRLVEALHEAESELAATEDPDARAALTDRIATMRRVRENLTRR